MQKGFIIGMLLPALLISTSSLLGQDSTARSLEEVVLTAERRKTEPLRTPYSIQKITDRQLQDLGARTTPEALAMINGVFVQKTNHGGGSPFVRGLTGNQVLVLVDGIRLNNSTFRYGPNQYMNTIDAYTINTIEVAKGTGSVQYGTDALGGVIQVFTKEPSFSGIKDWSGKALAKIMSGGMEKTGRAELQYSDNKMAMQAGITYRDFGDLVGGDTTGRQSPSGYKELAADLKLKFRLWPNWELVMAHQSLQQQHVPVFHKVVLENFAVNEMDPQQRMLSYARIRGTTRSRFLKQLEFTASWQYNKEGRNSRKNGSAVWRREQDDIHTLGITADVFSSVGKNWTANSGLEIYHDKVGSLREDQQQQTRSYTRLRGLYPDGAAYGNYSVYSLQHFSFSRFRIEAGARLNLFDIRISDTTLGKVSISPSAVVGNAAFLYQFDSRQSAFLAISSGYRAPNVDDMGTLGIVDFRYEVPASELRPERSLHTELGYKFSAGKIKATISLYLLGISDLITRVKEEGRFINGYQVYKKENIEKARLRGAEAELNWQATGNLNLSAGIAYAYGQNLTKNEPLRRVPPFNGRLIGTWRKKNFFTSVEALLASKQDRLAQGDKEDNRIPKGGTPGWKVFNAYAGYRLQAIQFNAGFQNILNEDYRTHGSGINGMGRSVFLSATVNL